MGNLRLGELLEQYGYITHEQINTALNYQNKHPGTRIGDALLTLGFVTENQVLLALGKRLAINIISFNQIPVNIEAVKKIPKQLCLSNNVIAYAIDDGVLKVALNDPLDYYAIEDIRRIANMPIEISLCDKSSILSQIEYYYAEIEAKNVAQTMAAQSKQIDINDFDLSADVETPAVKLLNSLLMKGYNSNASDIHIEPFNDATYVRIRIDGVLVDYVTVSKELHASLITRTKILSNMDIAEKRIPQDGHFRITLEGIELNIRVSVIPTVYGEKAVLRFLNTNTEIPNRNMFGMNEENAKKMEYLLGNPNGIIYLTGPTGSGKTTTLYMAIEKLAKGKVNISTIEDPIEKNIPRVNQMQVNVASGLTFSLGLRALLRQDPDIILVGETRDPETASISVTAAITGHLVLSTLHTNDAVATIVRLMDMGVDSYMIASSLKGVVAQRLVKKICPNCKKEYETTEEERKLLGTDRKTLFRGTGCHVCNFTGYKGRTSVHEIFIVDKNITKMISSKAPIEQIQEYAVKQGGLVPLSRSMRELVLNGVTTTEEFLKISYTL